MSPETEESPRGTTSAATTGARFAPVQRALDRISSLMPTWAWIVFWLVVATLYGLYGSEFNDGLYESVIQTLAYVMMALGLNIVVGFAGLLDLGYVAFFAIGAFVAGWFMSGHFADSEIYFIVVGPDAERPRHPHQLLLRALHRRGVHRAVGRDPRRPDAAPARRLPGDRDARVRRDRAARVRALDQRPVRHRQPRPLQRPPGHHAGRQALPAGAGPRRHHPHRHHALLLHRAGHDAARPVHQRPPARLAPRPRVDRGPRGRGRRGRDGRQPRAREALGLRDRRVDRRLRRRVPRRLPEHDQRRPVRVRLLRVHPLHDHPRRHGQPRRRDRSAPSRCR